MSQTKIITFLGKYPRETIYSHNDSTYKGQVFAEALHQFCEYDTMLVCVTEEAKATTWPLLEALGDGRIKPIDIPTGRTTEEMWETFKIITQYVDEDDRVIFDITHGLRSLPFLVFLFAAYLKAAKNVTIAAIYYGAPELSDSKNNVPAPVIDLSEFVSMIDWITATNQFVKIGDGRELAKLLENAIPSNSELSKIPSSRQIRDNFKSSSEAIENISLALSVTRPIETMESATKLEEILQKAAPSFADRAKPFSLLSGKVVQQYGQFALENPTDEASLSENLRLQFQMITWYIDRDQLVQAVTLAREWLVSILALRFGEPMFDHPKGRKYVEAALNNAVEKNKRHPRPIIESRCDEQFAALSEAGELASVWSKITQLRNDIAHCGMNLEPQDATNLKQKASSLYPRLQKLGESLLPQQ
ncbi:TIGR02221 family CRISPR-associated protein [Tychonema sp. LEGE 07203]|uniref:TIGR02221 family CRISPR-associated protein n=1 Tax=Tychonema sp. LEGE 07203 TaxID=1828671 RepID=UPI0018825C57|nr:TIGR02221 family CRISPR-associated protein [Tychonema sp. LEGE 07203]MBE9095867.1 TIGR02221 family CRISPR-associated protein [Tychonema sp. LEGE 07203]